MMTSAHPFALRMPAGVRRRRPIVRRGFTLVEAALVTVIVGVGFLAMLQLFMACTEQNIASNRRTIGMMLANNIFEATADLPLSDPKGNHPPIGPDGEPSVEYYNDVDDFDGAKLSPPVDAFCDEVPEMAKYTQEVTVVPVLPSQPSGNTDGSIAKDVYTGAVRVTVRVLYSESPGKSEEVCKSTWVRSEKTDTALAAGS